jgi:hypothetical protein
VVLLVEGQGFLLVVPSHQFPLLLRFSFFALSFFVFFVLLRKGGMEVERLKGRKEGRNERSRKERRGGRD